MNHWRHLYDPPAVTMRPIGRVHRLEVPEDLVPFGDTGRPRIPDAELRNPRRLAKPLPPKKPMTYPEAIAIQERARRRQPVSHADLMEALRIVKETRQALRLEAAT